MNIVSLPILISKEGKWFVACCPLLDIATQGTTEEEVKKNMEDLINEYLEDPDTQKPGLETIMSSSVTMTSIPIRIDYHGTKTSSITSA